MNAPDHIELAGVAQDCCPGVDARLVRLREAGVDRFDPVRWYYIEALARRAASYHGSTRQKLDARLTQALDALRERFELAQSDAAELVARGLEKYPHAAAELKGLQASGNVIGVQRLIGKLQSEQRETLGALVRLLEQHMPGNVDTLAEENPVSRPELKTVRNFRNTWAKLRVDKQVAQALEQAPKNAGPINSHMLVLRSLALMRDISPDYLNRFMTYADTLLSLDAGEKDKPAVPKKQQAKAGRK